MSDGNRFAFNSQSTLWACSTRLEFLIDILNLEQIKTEGPVRMSYQMLMRKNV